MFVLTLVYSILICVRQEKIPDSYDKCEPGLILDRICAQWYVNEPRMAALYPLLEFTGLHIAQNIERHVYTSRQTGVAHLSRKMLTNKNADAINFHQRENRTTN